MPGAWPNRKLEPDEEITLDTFVKDLASFIKELDLAPVHLVGHSSPGGFGGLVLAHRYPELLRSLVLLEPPAFPLLGVNIPPTPPQVLKLLARNPRAAIGFIKFGAKGIGPALLRTSGFPRPGPSTPRLAVWTRSTGRRWCAPDGYWQLAAQRLSSCS
ncbi:MAG: alpha/beta fold hydrolase [Candidatus Limnocylindria bacterium]